MSQPLLGIVRAALSVGRTALARSASRSTQGQNSRRRLFLEPLCDRLLMAGDVWTQRGGDSGHTSYVDIELNPTTLGEIWSQPLSYHQTIYGGSQRQALASDGERVFRTQPGAANTYYLIAFDLDSGEELWRQTILTHMNNSVGEPSVANGVVYVNREGHSSTSGNTDAGLPRLFGFDVVTGELLVQNNYSAQWGSEERPAIDGDQLLVEDGYYGGLSSYRASTLARQWNRGGSQYDLPLAAFSEDYIYAYGNQVYRRTTGATLPNLTHPWQAAKFVNPMVSAANQVLVDLSSTVNGAGRYGLASYNADTQALQWTTGTLAPIGTKAVGNGFVVATSGRNVLILNEEDGALLRSWQSPKDLTLEMVLTREHVFVQSYDGSHAKVHAIALSTGQEAWSYEYRQSYSSSAMEIAMVGDTLLLSHGNFVRALSPDWTSNTAPIANDLHLVTSEETAVYGMLSAVDADGQALTYSFVGGGAGLHTSQFNRTTGAFQYTPPANFYGDVVLTFQATDSSGAVSNVANVKISVRPVNDPPTVQNLSLATSEDTGVNGRLLAYDLDSALIFQIITPPTNGTLVSFNQESGQFRYVPKANFAGVDTFRFRVQDGEFWSSEALVTINVAPVNDVPVATDSSLTLRNDTDVSGRLRAIDVENASLTYELLTNPAHGFITSFDPKTGTFVYAPRAGFMGIDEFTFRASDGLAPSNVAKITIRVDAANQVPVAESQTLAATEDTPLAGVLNATDDFGPILYTISSLPKHGTLTGFDATTGHFVYEPKANFAGTDSFRFQANDGRFISSLATIELNVAQVNDRPLAFSRHLVLGEDEQAKGFLSALDLDGDLLTFTTVHEPSSGSLVIDATTGQYLYTPAPEFTGFDMFTFRVSDGQAESRLARICISVYPSNDSPLAIDSQWVTSAESSVTGQLGAIDGDSSLTYSLVTQPEHGVVTGLNQSTGDFTYVPSPGFHGQDQFIFSASDGTNFSRGKVTIQVTGVAEEFPVAIDILPGDETNTISLDSQFLKVAILGTATFQPHTMLDLASVKLQAPGSPTAALIWTRGDKFDVVDVNGDSWDDLIVQFEVAATGLKLDDTWLLLEGHLKAEFGGQEFSVGRQINVR